MRDAESPAPDGAADTFEQILEYTQGVVLVLLGALIVGSIGITLMSLLGVLPWLQIDARIGDARIPGFGPAIQVLFTLFCIALIAVLPASTRVLRLEHTHRTFNLTMDDIVRAFQAAHAADRAEVFTLKDDFSAVKERLEFLRKHPNLANLEPEILETAAQMSFLSRDLAEVYSDEAVTRAREFLLQRQTEIQRQRGEIDAALATSQELKRWSEDLHSEEEAARRLIDRVGKDLEEVLPQLGYELRRKDTNVLALPRSMERA